MEIKTCEQYVLSRLQELEQKNDKLIENIEELETSYDALMERYNFVENILVRYTQLKSFTSSTTGNECYYISFKDIDSWDKKTKDDFTALMVHLNLNTEEVEDGTGISN